MYLGGAISIVTILAYTAMAGTVGAGGLGDIAIRYGHQRGITSVMWVTVVILIILVQIVQSLFQLAVQENRQAAGHRPAPIYPPSTCSPALAHTK